MKVISQALMAVAILSIVSVYAPPAEAACSSEECYAAIAFNRNVGTGAAVTGYASKRKARAAAIVACEKVAGTVCDKVEVVVRGGRSGSCIAAALPRQPRDVYSAWGWAKGQSKRRAESQALEYCGRHASDCHVVASTCAK